MKSKGLKETLQTKLLKVIALLAIAGLLAVLPAQPILAGEGASSTEDITVLEVVKAKGMVEAKAEPNDSAETVMTFEDGAMIAVIADYDGTWYTIGYQGNTYYVKKADTELMPDSPFQQQTDDLEAEFEENYIESKILVEEVERLQEEAKSTRIWAIVIIVLVVAIVGINVYLVVKGKKEDQDKEVDKSR